MSETKHNPPAFPSVCLGDPGHPGSVPGMTLRDHFAGLAMAAIIAAPDGRFEELSRERVAFLAYDAAEWMLSERAKREGGHETR